MAKYVIPLLLPLWLLILVLLVALIFEPLTVALLTGLPF